MAAFQRLGEHHKVAYLSNNLKQSRMYNGSN